MVEGVASIRISFSSPAWAYWGIISPEFSPGSLMQKNGYPDREPSTIRLLRRSLILARPTAAMQALSISIPT